MNGPYTGSAGILAAGGLEARTPGRDSERGEVEGPTGASTSLALRSA